MTLQETRQAKITRLHSECHADALGALHKAWQIGKELIEQKAECNKGDFSLWLQCNCPFSERTAWHYIKLCSRLSATIAHGDIKPQSLTDAYRAFGILPEKVKQDTNREDVFDGLLDIAGILGTKYLRWRKQIFLSNREQADDQTVLEWYERLKEPAADFEWCKRRLAK